VTSFATGTGCRDMHEEDQDLARRCRQGDVSAYGELVRRHRKAAYRLARGILGDGEEAEDVTQEAFLRVYRSIARYNPRYAFSTWLRRITVNCAVTRLRKQRRERHNVTELESVAGNPEPNVEAVERLAADQVRRCIGAAARELPLRQGLAFTLFHLEDMNLAETAQAMGCSVSAVKVHLFRARRRLARELRAQLQEG